MTATVSATQLAQSILAIYHWSTPKTTMDALKATRYCFASVNQRMITVKGGSGPPSAASLRTVGGGAWTTTAVRML